MLKSGDRFGNYRVVRLLGQGGMGAVYLLENAEGGLIAAKILDPTTSGDHESRKRFVREAELALGVKHPNLVETYDVGEDPETGFCYILMEYVPGGSLADRIDQGPLPIDEAVRIVRQIASVLELARQKDIVHRDIKPANIMFGADGTAKLADLGIAKASNLGESLRTTTGSIFGTPTYVSPEQALSAADVDARADVYSLGIVLFEMVTGRVPYEGKNAPQILAQVMSDDPVPDVRDFCPSVSPLLAATIRRMCVKDRNRRIATPAALLVEFAKMGYGGGPKPTEVSYTPTGEALHKEETGIGEYLKRLPKEANDTLSFETKDVEIQEFVRKLKRRRRRKQIAYVATAVLLALLAILVLIC